MGKFIINRVKCFVIALAIVIGVLGGIVLYNQDNDDMASDMQVKVVDEYVVNVSAD